MSRRDKKEPQSNVSTLPKRRVIIMNKTVINSDSNDCLRFSQIRHPSSGSGASFLFSGDYKIVLEVIKFSDEKRSYFLDESVCSDGDLYFCTPIDPLFLVLPYLLKSKRCCPLDQILDDDEYPDIGRLLEIPMDVSQIADQRGDESLNAFIYNEEKTLLWLQTKLERLITVLKKKNINTSKNVAISANFVNCNEEEDSGASYIRYAYGMLLDYVPEELSAKFAESIKLPPEPEKRNKRKEIVSPEKPNGKKCKIDEDDFDERKIKTTNPQEKDLSQSQTTQQDEEDINMTDPDDPGICEKNPEKIKMAHTSSSMIPAEPPKKRSKRFVGNQSDKEIPIAITKLPQ